MSLSTKERLAILHTLIIIANADGRRGSLENSLLSEIASKALCFSLEDLLEGIIEEAALMKEEEVQTLISNLDFQKKLMIHKLLVEMATVDEVINEMELKVLHYMVKMYNLPPLV